MANHAVIRRILVFLRSDDLIVPQRGGLRRLGQGQAAEGAVRAAGIARTGAGGLDRVVGDGLMRDGAVFADAVTAPQKAQTVRVKPPVRQVGATVSVTADGRCRRPFRR